MWISESKAETVLKEHVVGKAIMEFHAQNICPMMCQICICSVHSGIINVVCVAAVLLCAHEGSGIGHCTHGAVQDGSFLASLQASSNE